MADNSNVGYNYHKSSVECLAFGGKRVRALILIYILIFSTQRKFIFIFFNNQRV